MAEKQLTANDPIDEELFEQLVTLRDAKQQFALRLLELEHEKIQILAASKRTELQTRRLFDQILVERGMDPTTEVFIDGQTRKLILKGAENPKAPEKENPKAEEPSEEG